VDGVADMTLIPQSNQQNNQLTTLILRLVAIEWWVELRGGVVGVWIVNIITPIKYQTPPNINRHQSSPINTNRHQSSPTTPNNTANITQQSHSPQFTCCCCCGCGDGGWCCWWWMS
jgi:hypothetical protein